MKKSIIKEDVDRNRKFITNEIIKELDAAEMSDSRQKLYSIILKTSLFLKKLKKSIN